jgi:cellulose synthase/poly-beta-1,6-N-acetylglucosamine synthase-like glycosyltransferase
MAPDKQKISVSLILTVKDDSVALQETLHSLEEQTRFPDEVILVLAESQDNTAEVARDWQKSQRNVRVVVKKYITRSQGRNLGAELAKHEILLFTDAGCLVEREWVKNISRPFSRSEVEFASGYTKGFQESAFQEAQAAFVLVPRNRIEQNPLPATRNMAIRKETFRKYRGFREDLNFAEDYEFARRLREAGIHAVFVADAEVSWKGRETLRDFFMMIVHLTRGDMLAGTWRNGHITMWARYLFFLGSFLLLWKVSGFSLALLGTMMLYGLYLGLKCSHFRFLQKESFRWAILFQVLADCAVLSGTAIGIRERNRV